jgi:hypothetical protein
VIVACGILLVGPWAGWSKAVTGRLSLQSYGAGYNLLLGAWGEGKGRHERQIREDPAFGRIFTAAWRLAPTQAELQRDPEAHPRYLARADASFRSEARRLYRERLGDEPGQVLWEAAYRMAYLWGLHTDWLQPQRLSRVLQALDAVLLVLAAAGVALALFRPGAARPVAVFLLAYTAVLGTSHVESRFSVPLRGFFLAFAAYAVARLAAALRRPA